MVSTLEGCWSLRPGNASLSLLTQVSWTTRFLSVLPGRSLPPVLGRSYDCGMMPELVPSTGGWLFWQSVCLEDLIVDSQQETRKQWHTPNLPVFCRWKTMVPEARWIGRLDKLMDSWLYKGRVSESRAWSVLTCVWLPHTCTHLYICIFLTLAHQYSKNTHTEMVEHCPH